MKFRTSATESLEMFCQDLDKHSFGQIQIFEWHMHFKADQMSVYDAEHLGRRVTSKTSEKVGKF